MPRIGEWITAKALADTALTDLIGTRIHPIIRPQVDQQENPLENYIVWLTSVEPADQAKQEAGQLSTYVVEFHIYALKYTLLDDIDDALRDLFDYQPGTAGGVNVNGSKYLGGQDGLTDTTEIFMRTARYQFRTRR